MATPHISAEPGDFAPAVLMPGDPKRAQRIAELLMDDARLVTDVRGILGYTGTVEGKPLSVMASGMGVPSAVIYATELYRFYDVQRIIRVGTCGGIPPYVKIGDVIVAIGAHAQSNFNQFRLPGFNFSAVASHNLAAAALGAAQNSQETVRTGTIICNDHFYLQGPPGELDLLTKYNVLGVDMESAGLYGAAAEFGREALTILTVSDHLQDPSQNMSVEDRENKFQGALRLAVAAAHSPA